MLSLISQIVFIALLVLFFSLKRTIAHGGIKAKVSRFLPFSISSWQKYADGWHMLATVCGEDGVIRCYKDGVETEVPS